MQFLIQFSGGWGVTREILHAKLSWLSCNGFLWLDLFLQLPILLRKKWVICKSVHSFYTSLASPIGVHVCLLWIAIFLEAWCFICPGHLFHNKLMSIDMLGDVFVGESCATFAKFTYDVAPWYVVLLSPFHNNFAKRAYSIYVVQVSKWGLQNEWMRDLRSANCLH